MNNNYNSNTVVKQDFAVMKQVDGRAAHMTETTRHQSWQSIPLPDHAGSHSRTQSPSYARSTECDEGLWPNPYQTGI